MTVWELAEQLEGTGVTINAMHPGSVHSGIGQNNGPLYRWFKKLVIDRTLMDRFTHLAEWHPTEQVSEFFVDVLQPSFEKDLAPGHSSATWLSRREISSARSSA